MNQEIKLKEKVFLYARVSTTSEEQLTSFNTQSNYKSSDYEIIEVFADYGKTATKVFNRPNFIEMLKRCNVIVEKHKGNIIFVSGDSTPAVNKILVSHSSRFMRNQMYMKQCLMELKKNNVEVIFLDMGKSSFDNDIDFVLNIFFLLDEQESRNTQFKVKRGLEKAREQRNYLPPCQKMLGFDYINGENRLIQNEDAPKAKMIFELYSEGKSMRDIAKIMDKKPNRIMEIIRNERYCGYVGYQKYYYDERSETNKKSKEYDIEPNERIEAIISKELWDKCQEIRASKTLRGKGVKNGTYAMSGKIKCSVCGKNFYHKGTNKRGDLWECSSKKNNGVCDSICFNEDTLKKFLLLPEGINSFKLTIEQVIDEVLSKYKIKDKSSLEKQLEDDLDRLERTKDLYMDREIDKEDYNNRSSKLKKNIASIEEEINNINNFNSYYNEAQELKNNFIEILNGYKVKLESGEAMEVFKHIEFITVGRMYDEEKEKIIPVVEKVRFKEFTPLYNILEKAEFMGLGVF